MATVLNAKKLRLQFDGGVVDGRSTTKSKTYSQVSLNAVDAQMYTAATTLSQLQTLTLLGVKKIEESTITA